MHVLVTGGVGFAGSHLVELHRARSDQVQVVGDLSTGARANLVRPVDNLNCHVNEADTLTRSRSEHVVGCADHMYHLAAGRHAPGDRRTEQGAGDQPCRLRPGQ